MIRRLDIRFFSFFYDLFSNSPFHIATIFLPSFVRRTHSINSNEFHDTKKKLYDSLSVSSSVSLNRAFLPSHSGKQIWEEARMEEAKTRKVPYKFLRTMEGRGKSSTVDDRSTVFALE